MAEIRCVQASRLATCQKGQCPNGHVAFCCPEGPLFYMPASRPHQAAIILGIAGLFPQVLCLGLVVLVPEWSWLAISAACLYAAIILSFLGGMWWMIGLVSNSRDAVPYVLGILPAIIGWLALLPWSLGWNWPGPSLIALGAALAASPLVDHALAGRVALPVRWNSLRWTLGMGLGVLSAIVGIHALMIMPVR